MDEILLKRATRLGFDGVTRLALRASVTCCNATKTQQKTPRRIAGKKRLR
jgi:hypothetical protein